MRAFVTHLGPTAASGPRLAAVRVLRSSHAVHTKMALR